ncbi:hypothetical protein Pcinc_038860 [Petrolisthes cinctipes]|uniref:Ubiquitin carboxyl-terminal hydrolase n=1 Tax=Petrolisthes cinctipes TaxID=88211 RepID=A0AAE1BPZ9_PETCI|nr:hypothetical protein Pcinc_038860 [Petrolisthes cinctipes]
MLDSSLLPVSLRTSAAVAGAFIIGAYVLFGTPTDITNRRRRKKDVIPGLANIGNSCFLNALVQSLASCPLFISWLRSKYSSTCPPLVSALHNLLQVLNNEDGGEGDACAGQVLGALRGHGWVISSEEQDTHELFHVLTSTIDDELTTASSVASLLDVAWLDVSCLTLLQEGVAMKADSWQHTNTGNAITDNSTGAKECLLPNTQGDGIFSKLNGVLKDDSQSNEHSQISKEMDTQPESKVGVEEEDAQETREPSCDMVRCSGGSVKQDSGDDIEIPNCDNTDIKESFENKTLTNHVPNSCGIEKDSSEAAALMPVMENLTLSCDKSESSSEDTTGMRKFPGVLVSSRCPNSDSMGGWRSRGDQHDIPFRGYLASQLQCTFCGYKNPAQWTSFESLSLSLPPVPWGEIALTELLDAYITPEKVTDVSCDGCSRRAHTLVKTTFTKQLTIGKLPDCLCFHIKRTVWLENGSAIKRRDHLTFPEFLVMDPYTYTTSITSQGGQKVLSGKQDQASNISSALGNRYQHMISTTSVSQGTTSSYQESNPPMPISRVKFEQLYRLRAVIVHVGDVFCGHFVTYRLGPIGSRARNRWFYTSDLLVREANLEEVQKANAYMILYEKVI